MAMQIALLATLTYAFWDRDILSDPLMKFWIVNPQSLLYFYYGMWAIFGIHFTELGITICTEYLKIRAMNAVSMAAGMILNLLWIIILTRLWYTFPYNFFQDYWMYDN